MRRSVIVLVARSMLTSAILLHLGCTRSTPANAVITAVTEVAAATALRAATGSCYATCGYGTGCDHRTGTCVPLQPEVSPEVDPCAEQCEIAAQDNAAGLAPIHKEGSQCKCAPPAAPQSATDPCGGMCLRNEKCVLKNGDLSCE